jgi:hypothetical protein
MKAGKGKPHRASTPSRMPMEYQWAMDKYLNWAKKQPTPPTPLEPKGVWVDRVKKDGLAMRMCVGIGADDKNQVTAGTKVPTWGQLKNVSDKPMVICTSKRAWARGSFTLTRNPDGSHSMGGLSEGRSGSNGMIGFPFRILQPGETYTTGPLRPVDIPQADTITITVSYAQSKSYSFHEHAQGRSCQYPTRTIKNGWVGNLKAPSPSLKIRRANKPLAKEPENKK